MDPHGSPGPYTPFLLQKMRMLLNHLRIHFVTLTDYCGSPFLHRLLYLLSQHYFLRSSGRLRLFRLQLYLLAI